MSKKYLKLKRKIIAGAASGALAGTLFFSGGTVWADSLEQVTRSVKQSPMHTMHNWGSGGKVAPLARGLGLDPEFVRAEIRSGKSIKQILLENGVDTSELGNI